MRLYFLSKEIANGSVAYNFILDGKDVQLMSMEACKLVSSIPKDERNCKVAFNQITLKSAVTNGKKVLT